MQVDRERRGVAGAEYYYRRSLGVRDSLPALGVGIVVGLTGFYLARLLLQRTPLVREPEIPMVGESGSIVRISPRRVARP